MDTKTIFNLTKESVDSIHFCLGLNEEGKLVTFIKITEPSYMEIWLDHVLSLSKEDVNTIDKFCHILTK